ncbi:hypothetical protein GCM10022409_17250 [Hymenobacter glaciei]|uniref:Uncharacterized protein n=1 Tax=Hymenobacter glaciei TaxID=877209 RepID=A0ABP7TZD1_9BACT
MDKILSEWVGPFYSGILHTNYVRLLQGDAREEFNRSVLQALVTIDERIVQQLFAPLNLQEDPHKSLGWKMKITGSWFSGLKGWQQFGTTIGELLIASETWYAGQGHCFALACFATEESAAYLTDVTQPVWSKCSAWL